MHKVVRNANVFHRGLLEAIQHHKVCVLMLKEKNMRKVFLSQIS